MFGLLSAFGQHAFENSCLFPAGRASVLRRMPGVPAGDPFDVPPIRLRFRCAFENMRRNAPVFQRFAEFDAQKA